MNEKERDEIQKKLRKLGDEFLDALKEEVDSCILLCDIDRLHNLTHAVDMVMGYEVLKVLRDKGFSKEITELCDKAGRVVKVV